MKAVLDTSVLVGAFYGDHAWQPACLARLDEAYKKDTFVRSAFKLGLGRTLMAGSPLNR